MMGSFVRTTHATLKLDVLLFQYPAMMEIPAQAIRVLKRGIKDVLTLAFPVTVASIPS
jgi:hypothetical protein